MSRRFMLLTVCVLSFLPLPAAAQDADNILGKTRSEWTKILLEHKETRFRRAAAIALGKMQKKQETIGILAQVMGKDTEPEVRREIAATMSEFGEDAKAVIDALAQRLEKDDNAKVREAAARSLGKLAPFAASQVPRLAKALKDASPETRAAAAEALLNFGDKAKQALPELTEAATDLKNDVFTRLYAVQILAKQAGDDEKTATVLGAILADRSAAAELRQAAVSGLANMGTAASGAVNVLVLIIEETKFSKEQEADLQELRRKSATVLGKIGPKAAPALPRILKLLHDPDIGLRYQLVRLTGTLGKDNPVAAKELIGLMKTEKNAEVLLAVIQESAELGIQDSVKILNDLSIDPRMSIRAAAKAALAKLKGS